MLGRIFEPFFTTKFTGRGLGLASVIGTVRAHGGALQVKSLVDRGTTFRLLFPACKLSPEELEPPVIEATTWRGRGTVLLVDDETAIRRVAKSMLKLLGLEVVEARSGSEALAALRTGGDEIDLVSTDLTMPHMDGEETFHGLRQMRPDVPVILMSGYDATEVVERATAKGLAGFLAKPFRLADLATVLQRVLRS